MDDIVFQWINGFAGQSVERDTFMRKIQSDYGKTLPVALLFWSMWFRYSDRRDALVALLAITIPAMITARLLALNLPFRLRPMYDPESNFNAPLDIPVHNWLDGWSAMPSDHATLFFSIAVSMLLISRGYGIIALMHAALVVCLPRVYLAEHWPSDILVGALLGTVISLILLKPVTFIVAKIQLVPFFEARGWLGYPLLFAATFELTQMFHGVREILGAIGGTSM